MPSSRSESLALGNPRPGGTTENGEYNLGLEEAARIMGRNPEDVTTLARVGTLRARRMGSRWRFRREDVLDCLARLSQIDNSF